MFYRFSANGFDSINVGCKLRPISRQALSMIFDLTALVIDDQIAIRPLSDEIDNGSERAPIAQCNFEGLFDVQFGVAHLGERLRQPLGLLFQRLRIRIGKATVRGDASPHDPRWVELLKQQIQPAEVELVAELAHAPATLEQLLALKAGDFIELDLKPVIQATIRGVPLFDCHYGTSNGKYSLKVDRLLDQSGTGWMRAGA